MNSLLEVSTKILALVGSDSPSEFRLNKLKNLPSFPENIDLQCQEIYLCKIQDTEEISDEDLIPPVSKVIPLPTMAYGLAPFFPP